MSDEEQARVRDAGSKTSGEQYLDILHLQKKWNTEDYQRLRTCKYVNSNDEYLEVVEEGTKTSAAKGDAFKKMIIVKGFAECKSECADELRKKLKVAAHDPRVAKSVVNESGSGTAVNELERKYNDPNNRDDVYLRFLFLVTLLLL
jgi:hypothetical protein